MAIGRGDLGIGPLSPWRIAVTVATKLYPRSEASTVTAPVTNLNSFIDERQLRLTAGSGLQSNDRATIAGPITCASARSIDSGTSTYLGFWSEPLDAVTISGTITVNFWMSESNMSANAGAEVFICRCDNSGGWIENILGCWGSGTIGTSVGTTPEFGTEMPVTTRAAQNWTATPASRTLSAGDRIFVAILANDGGGTMASTFTFDASYSGATPAADGDSWVQFTETITEQAIARVPYLSPMPSLLAQ